MENNNNVKAVMTPQECADYLGVSLRLVYKEIRLKNLPAVKCGDRYLLSRQAIERWLAGECQPTAEKQRTS